MHAIIFMHVSMRSLVNELTVLGCMLDLYQSDEAC